MTAYFTFAGIMFLGVASPGPDFAVVVRNCVSGGRRSGLWTAVGIAAGVFVWVTITAFGLSALLAASPTAFAAIRYAGAAYLAYLGITAIIAAFKPPGSSEEAAPSARFGPWQSLRSGLLCNLLSPKAAVFFVALIPQFIATDSGMWQAGVLAVLASTITVVWFLTLAGLVGVLRPVLVRPGVNAAVNVVTGLILIGIAGAVALGY
ncbi:LysE family translocator [Haloglycomyces albus]|uniref:LysE family translocator n=1 Tax=Haloglycomyces albus TaxID=526067 RepID=UPI0004A2BAEF|nr:LysE family translocator [Haloglycomyces albus]